MRPERITQNRIVQLLCDPKQLGYKYLGSWEEREGNSNIEELELREYLKDKYSQTLINNAIFDFKKAAALNSLDDLYAPNKTVYSLLRYGVKVREGAGDNPQTVNLIDWEYPLRNNFCVAEEVTIKGERIKRPDLVLYVNGIALATLELKRCSVSVSEGIRQNLDNQLHRFIKPFFTTIQLVLAGNDSQGLFYGTTKTSEKFFLKWKEDKYTYNPDENILDQHLKQFCGKERLLEIIHDFVLFEGGIKKLCRPNQYFGLKEAQKFVLRNEGGIIWHTQGSGKSLTMVWLAKWIREHIEDARLLIITDRTELDEQIEKVFFGVEEKIYRTKSGADLISQLNISDRWLLCTLIHKFGVSDDKATKDFIGELKVPKDFKPKGKLFVFIDECHRTQSGLLHKAMENLLGKETVIIGFTGTPLLKEDKKTSFEIFGRPIHTYKFDEAVKDGVVLDLLYEARDVDQHVLDQKGIDEWFDAVTKGMNDLPKAELKQKWGTMQKVLSSKTRLEKVAFDIIKDFKIKPRLRNGKGNAILVSHTIFEACRYYEIFQNFGFKKCAIITSFEPSAKSTKGETTGDGDTEKIEQYEIYQRMLNGKTTDEFEKTAKQQFIDEPANMQLLIVVGKLLTGFDAPKCTYLYIDKEMRDHTLFQAICRVNRTEEEKDFGYIVDYKNLFASGKMGQAIEDYTSAVFDKFDKKDIEGLVTDRLKKAKEDLESALEVMAELVQDVESPKGLEQYLKYFCGNTQDKEALKQTEEKRLTFYKVAVALIRAFNGVAGEMTEAGFSDKEAAEIKGKVDHYTELRNSIKIASGDYIDMKKYEPEMRQLLDMYLSADPSRTLTNFGDASLLQLIVENGIEDATDKLPGPIKRSRAAMAETLEANMRKVIIQEMPINPVYYEKMSVLLQELIEQRRIGAITYEQFLKKYEELAKSIRPKSSNQYPQTLDSDAKRNLFDNLSKNEPLALDIYQAIMTSRPDNWIGTAIKEKAVRIAISTAMKQHGIIDKNEVERILDLATKQGEFK